jgi:hypothetical protein
MPELGSYGSVRGAAGNSRPYRDCRPPVCAAPPSWGRHPQTFTKADLKPPMIDVRSSPGSGHSSGRRLRQLCAMNRHVQRFGRYF